MSSRPCRHRHRPARDLLRGAVLVAAVALAVAGCGDPDDPDPENDDPFADFEDRSETYSQLQGADLAGQVLLDAVCDVTWACYDNSPAIAEETQQSFGRFDSVQECRDKAHPMLGTEPFGQAVAAALEAGRMELDPSMAQECRRAYRARVCETDFETAARQLPGECETFFGGRLERDDPCVVSVACGPSLACNHTIETDGCHGECTPPDQLDQCGDEVCDDDQFCKFDVDQQEGPPGYRCLELVEEGGECASHGACQPGLACIYGRCREFTVGARGDDCTAGRHGSHCEPGLVCSPEPDSRIRTVATCSPVGTDGDRCYAQIQADSTGCAHDHYCETDDDRFGNCAPRSGLEADCTEGFQCTTGYCDFDDEEQDGGNAGQCTEPDFEICTHPADETDE